MNFEDYETLPTQNIAIHMTAGAIAGIMEHCVMYPLDSVKTRMQSLSVTTSTSVLGTLRHMVRQEGVLRPIRGMSAVVVGAGPAHALYFSTYEFAKETLTKSTHPRYHHFMYGASGCLASLIHDAISNPTEVVKQRLQMVNSPYRTVVQCVSQVYRAEGMKAFYRSYVTQLSMNIPFQSIHFTSYEFIQTLTNKDKSYNPPAHMVSGAVAGAIAAAATTPLDVCKTVLNTQEVKAKGLFDAIHYILRLSGPTGFFKGLQARVLYQMPAAAICWSTYESFKFLLLGRNKTDVVIASSSSEKPKSDLSTDKVLRLVLPQTSVKAETSSAESSSSPSPPPGEGIKGFKTMELPAMNGANLYGTLSLNTVHHGECQVPKLRHT